MLDKILKSQALAGALAGILLAVLIVVLPAMDGGRTFPAAPPAVEPCKCGPARPCSCPAPSVASPREYRVTCAYCRNTIRVTLPPPSTSGATGDLGAATKEPPR